MSIKLTTRHMQMIQALSESGSVSEAAEQIGVTQSALSHRIREAERLVGTALFYRHNKKLVPTSAGNRLLHSAQVILGELERAENDISKLTVGIEHVIRIGLESHSGCHWLPGFLRQFQLSHSSVSIEIIPDVSLAPLKALRQGHIDLTLISGRVAEGFRTLPLFTDEMMALLPANHLLGQHSWLSVEDIVAEPYIAYHTTPDKGREYEQLFSRYQRLPSRVIRAGMTEAVVEFVREGLGITIMPSWTAAPYLRQGGLQQRRVTEQGLFIDWQVVMRHDEASNSPVVTFARQMKKLLAHR